MAKRLGIAACLVGCAFVSLAPAALAECDAPTPGGQIDRAAPNPQQGAFLGVWEGTLQSQGPPICLKIAVLHIDADGSAKVILANGSFTISRGGANPAIPVGPGTQDIKGKIDAMGLNFTSRSGTIYLVKEDGTVTARPAVGSAATSRFTKR
jgi:hypothetical protein